MLKKNKIKYFIVGFALFVVFIFGLHVVKAQTFNFDLGHLRQQDELLTKAYDIINLQSAWEAMREEGLNFSGVVSMGIVDSGVQANHQEFLNPNVNFGSTPSFALVDSRTGGHGTQVAGIIGANNRLGSGGSLAEGSPQMNGVLSGALSESKYKLEVENIHKSLPSEGLGQVSSVYAALQNILEEERDVQVVNMSFGYPRCSALIIKVFCVKDQKEFNSMLDAFKLIFTRHPDILFVAAAGNEDIHATNAVPAALSTNTEVANLITVGATSLDDNREGGSNFGSTVNISAPGEKIYTPRPPSLFFSNRYDENFSKTSGATAMVTGVAGLLKAISPELTPLEIKQILIETADPIKTGEPNKTLGTGCYDPNNNPEGFTGCRLNAERAVQAVLPPSEPLSLDLTLSPNPATPIDSCLGGFPAWSYSAFITNTSSTPVNITNFTWDFFDSGDNFINRQFNGPFTFAQFFNSCAPGSSTISPNTTMCGGLCVHLGGRLSGSVTMTFNATDDFGNPVSASETVQLPEDPHIFQLFQQEEFIDAAGSNKD